MTKESIDADMKELGQKVWAESDARTLRELAEKTGRPLWKTERGPNGRARCRWCYLEVPKGRRTFCGDACVHEWRIRSSPGYARVQVFKRDRGVCQNPDCHRDTEVLVAELRQLRWGDREVYRGRIEQLRAAGFDEHSLLERVLWHMDHIVEVVNGGGTCGLENLTTLCIPCHKAKTKKLAAERARQRRQSKAQPSVPETT